MKKYFSGIKRVPKFNTFVIFSNENGKSVQRDVSCENKMTLSEAMRHFKVGAIKGIK